MSKTSIGGSALQLADAANGQKGYDNYSEHQVAAREVVVGYFSVRLQDNFVERLWIVLAVEV
jgi:hypothetical protein